MTRLMLSATIWVLVYTTALATLAGKEMVTPAVISTSAQAARVKTRQCAQSLGVPQARSQTDWLATPPYWVYQVLIRSHASAMQDLQTGCATTWSYQTSLRIASVSKVAGAMSTLMSVPATRVKTAQSAPIQLRTRRCPTMRTIVHVSLDTPMACARTTSSSSTVLSARFPRVATATWMWTSA